MFLLVASVEFGVVRLSVGEHLEDDFEQALPQAAEGTRVTQALLPFFLIVGLSPDTGLAETVGPKVNRVPQESVAGPAHLGLADLAGLITDRRGAGKALEDLLMAVALGISSDGGQQPWG